MQQTVDVDVTKEGNAATILVSGSLFFYCAAAVMDSADTETDADAVTTAA